MRKRGEEERVAVDVEFDGVDAGGAREQAPGLLGINSYNWAVSHRRGLLSLYAAKSQVQWLRWPG